MGKAVSCLTPASARTANEPLETMANTPNRLLSMRLLLTLAAITLLAPLAALALPVDAVRISDESRRTRVSLEGAAVHINGQPTLKGLKWRGVPVEGLLPNMRVVQGTFDDLNPETRAQWAYPDTGVWDPERNTGECVEAMSEWRAKGLLGITLNLQGGSPLGYGNKGWINTAFEADGSLRPAYFSRLERLLNRSDELGMVVILGLFYFGQDHTLLDERAVLKAARGTVEWLFERKYTHVLLEVCNESTEKGYDHALLRPNGVATLIRTLRAQKQEGRSFPVGVSFSGGELPPDSVVAASDFLLLHGNNQKGVETTPAVLRGLIRATRALPSYRPMLVIINEDDHYAFDAAENNFLVATAEYVSWGYFDFRRPGEAFAEGLQSVPVNWRMNTPRKKAFMDLVSEMASGR